MHSFSLPGLTLTLGNVLWDCGLGKQKSKKFHCLFPQVWPVKANETTFCLSRDSFLPCFAHLIQFLNGILEMAAFHANTTTESLDIVLMLCVCDLSLINMITMISTINKCSLRVFDISKSLKIIIR